ncbi:MAG: glycoside hydrolase family 57 protein, partial [Phycisphaerales bacterium]|nr:glycoside hydrolase family 57 protein [Phycisphaerales bacterium]
MASVVFYFQVHQPYRLRRYSVFDSDPFYFDSQKNGEIARKVADKCYRPMTNLVLDLVKRNEGRFRVSYSITGVALDQFVEHTPYVIDTFKRLADTGCCEFLAETYHHSLAFLYSREEFKTQVDAHTRKIQDLFGQTPTVFRNTELIYSNDVARYVSQMKGPDGKPRFYGQLCEGTDPLLGYRSPNYLYLPPGASAGRGGKPFGLLLKNYRLSDDVAFRFSNRGWADWPLTAEKFAGWVNKINGDGNVCNLFMDYETFGEHQWADTGIFKFIDALPEKIFDANPGQNEFLTPTQAFQKYDAVGDYDVPHMISWADTERDLSAWLGNAMQSNALNEAYRLEKLVRQKIERAAAGGDEAAKRQ